MKNKGRGYYQISKKLINSIDADDEDLLKAIESLLEEYKNSRNVKAVPRLPLSIFSNRKLGILESLVKSLKENFSLNYSKIAVLINRDDRTIWTAYYKAKGKLSQRFSFDEEEPVIPCDIFSDRNLGPLEALTVYCRDILKLSFIEISDILNRDYRTIWLSYNNGIKKKVDNGKRLQEQT